MSLSGITEPRLGCHRFMSQSMHNECVSLGVCVCEYVCMYLVCRSTSVSLDARVCVNVIKWVTYVSLIGYAYVCVILCVLPGLITQHCFSMYVMVFSICM